VLHVAQPTEGGTAKVVQQVASASTAAGHRVTVACPPGELAEWTVDARLRWAPIDMARSPEPRDALNVVRLRRLAVEHDVMHLHSSKAGAVGRAAIATLPPGRRPKCIFTPHGWSWYIGGRSAAVYRRWERLAVRWADVITPVSSAELSAGRDVLSPSAWPKLRRIDNGVDTTEFAPEGPASPRGAGALILCVGRLSEQKGQDLLIEALPRLRHRSATLRLLGAGPAGAQLEVLADKANVSGRVEFVSPEDPRPHYRAADLVVLPSRWEGLPLVLLEAMACGAPVIASREAAGDVLGQYGVVVDPGTGPAGWAEAIDALLDDPARRAAMAGAARQHVLRLHQVGQTTQRYVSLIEQLHQEQRIFVSNDRLNSPKASRPQGVTSAPLDLETGPRAPWVPARRPSFTQAEA
jgi:glycosyltransferase involved in cell wall biosynthesis